MIPKFILQFALNVVNIALAAEEAGIEEVSLMHHASRAKLPHAASVRLNGFISWLLRYKILY